MKISESWLREWVNPAIDTQALVAQLTMAGLEVDAVEPVAGDFTGVVVGEILSVAPHPNADKLRVCQVAGNGEPLQVVCGAPNARAGIKVPFAVVGARLPGDFTIKKAKLRDVESFGMLCAQTELQAGEDDEGLWELPADAPVGADLRDYLQLNDRIIELDLTPNRSDCLGIKGLAREVGALNRAAVTPPAIQPVAPVIDDVLPVTLTAAAECPRYVGRVIRGVDIRRPSPAWLQEKLRRAGLRPIDAVVDVTNYVLLELGQPMHAFDLKRLEGGIEVRLARPGEPLRLLDGQEVELDGETLVIADSKQALAMAGVMGGEASAVHQGTRDIFLESAFFAPLAIAGRARRYGLHTDSSHRFERGVDYDLQVTAVERATALLLEIVGGEPGPVIHASKPEQMPAVRQVSLSRARIVSGLSVDLAPAEVEDILTRLGLVVVERSEQGWQFSVPSYRFDLAIEEDLLEELARVYGYNNLPTRSLAAPMAIAPRPESVLPLSAVRRHLVALGYEEAITYSFIDPKLSVLFAPELTPVALRNPISADMAVMRPSLWPGLVETLRRNLNRQQGRVRLFESGLRFVPSGDGWTQEPMLAGLIYGSRWPESWAHGDANVDFYDIKGDLESLLALTGQTITFAPGSHAALHPGQCAQLLQGEQPCGYLGSLHPQLQQSLDIPAPVLLFEIPLSLVAGARLPAFAPLSRYPEVRRDLALLVDRSLPVEALLSAARSRAGEHLVNLKVFDVYQGEGIDPQRKSVALGLTFRHASRTLTEDDVSAATQAVVQHLEDRFNATLR